VITPEPTNEFPWISIWRLAKPHANYCVDRFFLRRFRDPIRVPRIRENYHRVPKIREIGSLQIQTGFLTVYIKKNWCRYIQSTLAAFAESYRLLHVTLSKELMAVHVWNAPDLRHNWRVAGVPTPPCQAKCKKRAPT